jgi:hypothetical protein
VPLAAAEKFNTRHIAGVIGARNETALAISSGSRARVGKNALLKTPERMVG